MTLRTLVVLVVEAGLTLVLTAVATLLLLAPGSAPVLDRTLVPLWAALVTRVAGVRYRVEGRERIPSGPVVFVANHRSHFDIPVLWLAIGRPFRFIAKRELTRVPFFGWAMVLLGHVVIDRGDSDQARATMAKAVRRVRGGVPVLVFAEGTRGTPELIARERLGPLKKGGIILAIRAGVPLVPVAVAGTETVLPKRSLAIRAADVRVTIGPPIETRGLTDADRDRVAAALRGFLYAALDPAAGTALERVGT